MPFCPVCRYEYIPGIAECADCGAALVDELPTKRSPLQAATANDVVVARVHGQALAQMWAELLGNRGIASRMSPLTGMADTVYPTDTVYEVLVAAPDAPRARAILPPHPGADRIHAVRPDPSDDEILEEIERAIAKGDVDRADELLSSLEDEESAEFD